MKATKILAGLAVLALVLARPGFTASKAVNEPVWIGPTVRTTAYTHSENAGERWAKLNAIETPLRAEVAYTSAAADWSRFPLGTKFRIAGEPTIYVIDDYGSALVGTNTIDIYRPTRGSMDAWGVRLVNIEILELGDFERSLSVLASRLKHPWCKRMHDAIGERLRTPDKTTSPQLIQPTAQ